jgi:hypothetical protein
MLNNIFMDRIYIYETINHDVVLITRAVIMLLICKQRFIGNSFWVIFLSLLYNIFVAWLGAILHLLCVWPEDTYLWYIHGWLDTNCAVCPVIIENIFESWTDDTTLILRYGTLRVKSKKGHGCKWTRKPIQLATSTQLKVVLYYIATLWSLLNNSYHKLSVKQLLDCC